MSITAPKSANYLYFNHKNDFGITLDGTQLTLTTASSGSGGQSGQPGPGTPNQSDSSNNNDDDDDDDDPVVVKTDGYFIKSLNILVIFGFLLF